MQLLNHVAKQALDFPNCFVSVFKKYYFITGSQIWEKIKIRKYLRRLNETLFSILPQKVTTQ